MKKHKDGNELTVRVEIKDAANLPKEGYQLELTPMASLLLRLLLKVSAMPCRLCCSLSFGHISIIRICCPALESKMHRNMPGEDCIWM